MTHGAPSISIGADKCRFMSSSMTTALIFKPLKTRGLWQGWHLRKALRNFKVRDDDAHVTLASGSGI